MGRNKRAWWLLLAAAVIALDLWSKGAWEYPQHQDGTPDLDGAPRVERVLIDGLFEIRTIWNVGGVWSLRVPQTVLFLVTLAAAPLLLAWIFWPPRVRMAETIGKALVLGGAIGNLYDRWRFEAVRDFIQVYLFGWPYPTFNVADVALLCGILLILVVSWRKPETVKPAAEGAR